MTSLIQWICFAAALVQTDVPYKPEDEFKVDLKLELKQKPVNDRYHVDFNETWEDRNKNTASMLPYLTVQIKFLKFGENEVRVKGYNNKGEPVCNKKLDADLVVKLELGFTEDLKDRVTPHEFNIYTLDSKKKEVYRIHLVIQEDGTFLVNDKMRGKF